MENQLNQSEKQPEKKKRGRKPKIKTEEEIIPKILKKRGRKPKIKTEEEMKPKIPKKRGRKPKDKYGIVPQNSQNINEFNIVEENIILHLPIKSGLIINNEFTDKVLLEYNPVISEPQPFTKSFDNSKSDMAPYPFNNRLSTNLSDINNTDINKTDVDTSNAVIDNKGDNMSNINSNKNHINDNKSHINDNSTHINDNITYMNDNITYMNDNIISSENFNEIDLSENYDFDLNEDTINLCNKNINKPEVKDKSTESKSKNIDKEYTYISYSQDCKINYTPIIEKLDNYKSGTNNINKNILNKNNIMTDFKNTNANKSWPSSTTINCFWCCHPFNKTTPCAIPYSKTNNVYHVYGSFCSPECAAAFNFDNSEDTCEI